MSDGPYKSLPMKPRWRHAAKCAYKEAFSQDEIVESVTRASHADWRAEVRQALVTSVTAVVATRGLALRISKSPPATAVIEMDRLLPPELAGVGTLTVPADCPTAIVICAPFESVTTTSLPETGEPRLAV